MLTIFLYGLFLILFSKSAAAQTIDSIPITNQQQFLIHSKSVNEDRTVWVHTPPEYDASTDNYPVLYLLDGGSYFIFQVLRQILFQE